MCKITNDNIAFKYPIQETFNFRDKKEKYFKYLIIVFVYIIYIHIYEYNINSDQFCDILKHYAFQIYFCFSNYFCNFVIFWFFDNDKCILQGLFSMTRISHMI